MLEYAKISGCTVHFVDNQYDHGPIILQYRVVPVLDDDTPDTLAGRVFAAECEAYPEALRLFASGAFASTGEVFGLKHGRSAGASAAPTMCPRHALTVGLRTLLAARELLLIVTGAEKAEALHAALEGPIGPARAGLPAARHPA